MIRVDHAGERGADTIYNGQWDVLKDTESGDLIKVRIRTPLYLPEDGGFHEPALDVNIFSTCGNKKKSIWQLLNNY